MIYEDDPMSILKKRVTEEDLDNLAKSLDKLLKVYWSKIYFQEDEEQLMTFKQIEQILVLLKTKQYDQLFDDPEVIMTYYEMRMIK